ncbi:MAG: hypothetical protein Q4P79_01805 [Fusobacterium sp.]|nr:hypothetical protein [Fusobacterium sp.]MDO5788170.1 hypothetical protein [Fusobacterium sp.]
MALTKQQIAMVGVYGALPNGVTNFFTRRIAKGKIPFITNMATISFEEVEKFAKNAKILQRGAEFPAAKLNGSTIKSVTPEMIKSSIPFYAEDQLNRQPGQITYINGKAVDNATYERDRRIASIKMSIETVKEEISAGVMLKGSYKSLDTKNEVKYSNFPSGTSVSKTSIKSWGIFTTQKVNDFQKKNGAQVSEILVGEDVFFDIIKEHNSQNNVMFPATPKRLQAEDGQWELQVEAFGFTYTLLPGATDTEGGTIDTKTYFMLYNDLAFLPTYAGVVNVNNGVATMEAIDVLVRETPANAKTGESETLGESGYCPVIPNPSLINLYKINGLS